MERHGPITALHLQPKTALTLQRVGITTVSQVRVMPDSYLLTIRNFGKGMLSELHQKLTAFDREEPPVIGRLIAIELTDAQWALLEAQARRSGKTLTESINSTFSYYAFLLESGVSSEAMSSAPLSSSLFAHSGP